jgi:hypothetical protein
VAPSGFWGRAQGNRFVVMDATGGSTSKTLFHTFEWSPASGWTSMGSADVSLGQTATQVDLRNAVIGTNHVAVVVQLDASEQIQIYDITTAGLQLRAAWDAEYWLNLTIAGNYLFRTTGATGNAIIHDMVRGADIQTVARPVGLRFWDGLYSVGHAKLMVNARHAAYWLALQGDTWSLEPTPVDPSLYGHYFTGGNGSVIINFFSDSIWNALWRVYRASDGTLVGKLNKKSDDVALTNGRVVVQIPRVRDSNRGLEIRVIPEDLPPGC